MHDSGIGLGLAQMMSEPQIPSIRLECQGYPGGYHAEVLGLEAINMSSWEFRLAGLEAAGIVVAACAARAIVGIAKI